MENPNVKFTIQFIINYLVWNILLGIAGRLIAAASITAFSVDGLNICYVVVFTLEISILISAILSIFMTQRTLGKKCEPSDNNMNGLYISVSFILIFINVIMSFLGYSYIYKMCEGNISMTSLANHLVDSNGISFESALNQSVNLIHKTVKNAILIANIFFSIIVISLIPIFNKWHKSKKSSLYQAR